MLTEESCSSVPLIRLSCLMFSFVIQLKLSRTFKEISKSSIFQAFTFSYDNL